MRIAVIGGGISGMLAARLLAAEHEVCLFEAGDVAGGHANTAAVEAFGTTLRVDTGFMVFNERTYPNFSRLLRILDVASQPSNMSFSVRCERTGLEYQGSSLNGLFAQRRNLLRPAFLSMLRGILRFNRAASDDYARGNLDDGQTVGELLDRHRIGRPTIDQYLAPMAAAIWSAAPGQVLEFPAKFFVGFCRNHGLLQLRDRPPWKTVVGGSRHYVQALVEPIRESIRLRAPVAEVARDRNGICVCTQAGSVERFDQAVLAVHADQALALLRSPSRLERDVLGSFPYQQNQAVLHTDASMLPRRRRAWASWNYSIPRAAIDAASVTYDLSRLQQLATPSPLLLTLNRVEPIAPEKIVRRFSVSHPLYTRASIAAQNRHGEVSGADRIHYCGAYWGFGFHEDGVNSALAVARQFGLTLDACTVRSTPAALPTAASAR